MRDVVNGVPVYNFREECCHYRYAGLVNVTIKQGPTTGNPAGHWHLTANRCGATTGCRRYWISIDIEDTRVALCRGHSAFHRNLEIRAIRAGYSHAANVWPSTCTSRNAYRRRYGETVNVSRTWQTGNRD